ncbi:hypothetical protein OIU34_18980 [Pararhizobium sp. BT-229]|uniref:hypothetical protein n=1 Tax=Pararhizobium sp. BT-229 TaxID=2986923 RepID=UPI0021F6B05C|nr:hypothetical protein [Pararhizobium sp. BT-229]MCV9963966.1 hypothetical protein [Pararhizobium sp. BT-229]
MKQVIKDVIAQLEEAEGPSEAIDMAIVEMTMFPYQGCTRSIDAALDLALLAPGWYIEHAGDNAGGEVGNLRVFGHTVEYSNGVETVQGDAPTKPLAYCLAIMKAYLAEWEAAEKRVVDMLAADDRVSASVRADVVAVISNIVAPFELPEAEIDEDDHSIILRWTRDERSLSLTFLGQGFVGGYLIHPTDKKPAFRHEVSDSAWLRARLSRELVSNLIRRRTTR